MINIKKQELLFYIFALALLLTFYDFPDIWWDNSSNLAAYLSKIIKTADSNYLTNDFYFQANQGFGPRYYYIKFFQLFTNSNNFAYVALFTHISLKFSLCLITVLLAKQMFPGNRLALFLAPASIMTIEGPMFLKYGNVLQHDSMSPQLMSLPFILLSLLMALRLNPIKCTLLAYTASLFHPNVGTIFGLIFLLSQLAVVLVQKKFAGINLSLKKYFLPILIFVLLIVITWVIPLLRQPRIPDQEFIDTMIFRAPHHLLFSSANWMTYFNLAAFIITSAISIGLWQRFYQIQNSDKLIITLIFFSIPFIFLLGWLLTDVYPHRLGPTLFASRYIELLRYIGIVLTSGISSHLLLNWRNLPIRSTVFTLSLPHPFQAAITAAFIRFANIRFFEKNYLLFILLIVFGLSTYNLYPISKQALYFFSMPIVLFYALPKKRAVPNLILLVFVSIIIFGVFTKCAYYPKSVQPFYRILGISKFSQQPPLTPFSEIAKYVKGNTETDALFLTPPSFTSFRVIAGRALLVDFKSFPFQDMAMREWKNRLMDVFGPFKSTGFLINKFSTKSYSKISTDKLKFLRSKYSIDYAILYHNTPTIFPVLYSNSEYKLVKIL